MDKWLDTHADSEQGRQEILDILSARDAGRILERLPLERIVKWMDTGTQEWAKWKGPQGQPLFLLWISSRQPHDRYVKPSVLREIVQKAPNWLTEHTSDGRVVIDTMALPDELDSEIKQTLLDLERADLPNRPKSKRRF